MTHLPPQIRKKRGDDVNSERIDEGSYPCVPHESLNPSQVGVAKKWHARLQQNNGGKAALEDWLRPQFRAQRSDLVVRHAGVSTTRVSNRSPDSPD
jgi:hypothetical protein